MTANKKNWRILKRNGSLNIAVKRYSASNLMDFYHWMLRLSWLEFLVFIIGMYFVLNLFFGSLF